jgi:hypothetical protein
MAHGADSIAKPSPAKIQLTDWSSWKAAVASQKPVLVHLNADTTWLIQLPLPPSSAASGRRSHFNILIDPWLNGPQSDVAPWFSTQWHVTAPGVRNLAVLNSLLAGLERETLPQTHDTVRGDGETAWYIDVVAVSHEFTDHCHRETLLEMPPKTPVFASEKAADLIRSWNHFDTVSTTSPFPSADHNLPEASGILPPWLRIARIVTPGNSLYYHSALLIAFDTTDGGFSSSRDAIIYSPHGIRGADLTSVKEAGLRTLALLHGLHDVRIWMMAQLNLGALNGLEAVAESGARFWVATHDEVKRGGGLIAGLLRRTTWTLGDAVRAAEQRLAAVRDVKDQKAASRPSYEFVALESGEGIVLEV